MTESPFATASKMYSLYTKAVNEEGYVQSFPYWCRQRLDNEKVSKLKPDEIQAINVMFHRLWTKSVGQRDYVKSEWSALAKALTRAGIPV